MPPKHLRFSDQLMNWYKKNARDLPWRHTRDPYRIWISEVMLQQTTVNTVIPYYKRWLKQFPSLQSVARAPIERILKLWQGLGYYQRAKNIHSSARRIYQEYDNQIPQDIKELEKLPGFGPYTCGAVLSIAFDQRQPIIDANVRRVVMRLQGIKGHADSSKDKQIYSYLGKAMPPQGNNIFNQALMELGALVCRNREPLCNICPVKASCRAYKKGIQEIIPIPKKKVIKEVQAVIAVIKNKNRYFIQKRPSSGLLADLWEFPGGKIEKGEEAKEALYREVSEEIQCEIISAKQLFLITHYYTQFRIKLGVWSCVLKKYPREDRTHKWVSLHDLEKYPMPSGSAKIVEKLLSSDHRARKPS